MTADGRIERGHALYEGVVWHHRRAPDHRFSQRLTMAWLDLDALGSALSCSKLFSSRGGAPAQFRRRDHLGAPGVPLAEEVRALVTDELGVRPVGAVHVLTNLRTWGWCFNPLTVFWCGDGDGRAVAQVLAVTNTPWHETHCYVIDRRGVHRPSVSFDKAMHVSPFLPMDLRYTLRDAPPEERLDLTLSVSSGDVEVFVAGVDASRRPLDAAGVRRLLWRDPTVRVSLGIHLQAARLWRKGAAFVPHPNRRAGRTAAIPTRSRA